MRPLCAFLTLAIGLDLGGCMNPISAPLPKEEAMRATYPAPPTKAKIQAYLRFALLDAKAAEFDHWILYRGYLKSKPPIFAHIVSVDVNAKNAFGGYTGFKRYILLAHGDGTIRDASAAAEFIEYVDAIDFPEK